MDLVSEDDFWIKIRPSCQLFQIPFSGVRSVPIFMGVGLRCSVKDGIISALLDGVNTKCLRAKDSIENRAERIP